MQKFGNTLITNQGRTMLTAVDGAQGKLTYTKAILSTQDTKSMSDDDVRVLEQLTDDKLEAPINVIDLRDNTVTIGVSFNNAQVVQDIKFNSIGWFAKTSVDSQEKLLAVTPSESEQILVAGSNGQSTASTDIELVMARSHNTTVTINPTAVGLINNEQLESAVNTAKNQLNNNVEKAKVELNAWKTKIDGTISQGYVELPVEDSKIQQLHDHDGNALSFKKSLIYYDATLSKQGAAAEAYAVGQRINDLDTGLIQLNQKIYKNFDAKSELDPKLADKADRSDVTTLQEKVTSQGTEIAKKANSAEVYTKSEINPMIEQAGKVKSVNGIKPDNKTGDITIPAPNLSGLETKTDAKTAHDSLTKKTSDNATEISKNADANNRQDEQINGLITRTNEIESGVINNSRTIRILSHDGKSLTTHASATITARTEYIKTDSTLSDYGAVANAGKVGEAIKQTFLILNAPITQLVADYNSLQSNQAIVDLTNQVLALKDQNEAAEHTIQILKKSVEISDAESQQDNLDALHDSGRYYLGDTMGYNDAVLEVDALGNTNKVMQYIFDAGNSQDRSQRRIGTKSGSSYSWSEWNDEY